MRAPVKGETDRVDDTDAMSHANADFGNRLVTKQGPPPRGLAWVFFGALLVGGGFFLEFAKVPAGPWAQRASLARTHHAHRAAGGLGAFGICVGFFRLRGTRSARHFYHSGATYERGGRRQSLAYADVETVTYAVRTDGDRVQRSLEFVGPGGKPRMRLATDLADDEAGDERVASVAEVVNVSTRVVGIVTAKMIERVDQGEVVKWADKLWLDPAGVRLGEPQGKLVPWGAVEGVKDGSTDGRIEVYAFGLSQPLAATMTHEPNALPGYNAFRYLLDRAQAARAA